MPHLQGALEYLETDEPMTCAICYKTFPSKTRCVKGHYVCDECHTAGLDSIIGAALSVRSTFIKIGE